MLFGIRLMDPVDLGGTQSVNGGDSEKVRIEQNGFLNDPRHAAGVRQLFTFGLPEVPGGR